MTPLTRRLIEDGLGRIPASPWDLLRERVALIGALRAVLPIARRARSNSPEDLAAIAQANAVLEGVEA